MNRLILFIFLLTLYACNVSERPIEYGTDDCDYCKMIIMDHRYGSELVTNKGKVYMFDAAECLIDYLHYNEDIRLAAKYLLITPYTHPDQLSDAKSATYLVSGQMASPMGAYLTAFASKEIAVQFQADNGGDLYAWDELYKNFRAIRLKAIQDNE
jgi:copper chaperone NosL